MLIGVTGFARVGKDTFADHLVENHGYKKLSFADPMREALLRLDPVLRLHDGSVANLTQLISTMSWDELKANSPDIRPLLQRLGTEVGREMFGQNFWVDLALKEAAKYENVIFADVRFLNELRAIENNGGVMLRINREGYGPANNHVSELELAYEPMAELYNCGSLEGFKKICEFAFAFLALSDLP